MKKMILSLCLMLAAAGTLQAAPPTDNGVLLRAYTQYVLAGEVQSQILQMAGTAPEAEQEQIRAQAQKWMSSQSDELRTTLDRRFGPDARSRFADFVSRYTTAEKTQDQAYLEQLTTEAGLPVSPAGFPELKRFILEQELAVPFHDGSRLLGEIQTWQEIKALSPQTPPLQSWLDRKTTAAASDKAPAKPAPAPSRNPLRAAEASAPEWTPPPSEPPQNPMDAFAESRTAERSRILTEAQAGMQQMALERQAAEQEYAAQKAADAQADADAVKAQAQKLAATEEEAVEQRANSWCGRLKKIVSATVGAATGAFTGGIGTEAGRQAADALFN